MKLNAEVIKEFYRAGRWNSLQVEMAYTKGVITKAERDEILEKAH